MENKRITVRQAVYVKADLSAIPEIVAVSENIWKKTFYAIHPKEKVDYLYEKWYTAPEIERLITSGEQKYTLVKLDGETVAFFAISHFADEPKEVKLNRFYIKGEYHGTGLATAMMYEVMRSCREKGYELIRLNVAYDNARAVAFYKKLDFEIIDHVIIPVNEQIQLEDYIMRRPI